MDKDFIETLGTRSTDPANSRRRRIMTLGDVVAYLDATKNRPPANSPSDRPEPEEVAIELLASLYGTGSKAIEKLSKIQTVDGDGNILYDVLIEYSMVNDTLQPKVSVSTNFLMSNIQSNLDTPRNSQREGVWKIGGVLTGIPTLEKAEEIANQIDHRRVKCRRKIEMLEKFQHEFGMSKKICFIQGLLPPDPPKQRPPKN